MKNDDHTNAIPDPSRSPTSGQRADRSRARTSDNAPDALARAKAAGTANSLRAYLDRHSPFPQKPDTYRLGGFASSGFAALV